MALPSAVFGGHQAGLAEHPEVPADRRSADLVVGCEVDHAGGAAGEPVHQVPTDRVRECGEHIHDSIGNVLVTNM